jgi:uncharacterized protein
VRALLDTNVVISAVLFGGLPRQILKAALEGGLDVITSPALLAELERVLTRKFAFNSTTAASIRSELEALGRVIEPASIKRVTKSSADDLVLAAAIAGEVDVIVTGDRELLDIATYENIRIESPRTFLEGLEKST